MHAWRCLCRLVVATGCSDQHIRYFTIVHGLVLPILVAACPPALKLKGTAPAARRPGPGAVKESREEVAVKAGQGGRCDV
ncbi:hypothetical protein U9M48_021733 [Paspalum notatum var. saurae]|uniref:Uncharacterized protein n=1 Tax=Paspalum notatum var. saurae TaxID=547442 RepID=A0AAQ3TL96_PASNO